MSDSNEHDLAEDAEVSQSAQMATSQFFPEQKMIGQLPHFVYMGMQFIAVTFAVFSIRTLPYNNAARAGWQEPNEMLWVSSMFAGVAFGSTIFTIESTRFTLRAGGTMDQLGAGEQMISSVNTKVLMRSRILLVTLSALIGTMLLLLWGGTAIRGKDAASGHVLTAEQRTFQLFGAIYAIFVIPTLFAGWWAAMYTASCLCRESIDRVIDAVELAGGLVVDRNSQRTWFLPQNHKSKNRKSEKTENADTFATTQNPLDANDENGNSSTNLPALSDFQSLEHPVLALRERMRILSRGFSLGLLGLIGFVVCVSAMMLTLAINTDYMDAIDTSAGVSHGHFRSIHFLICAFFAFLPLFIVKDVATTSSRCDVLIEKLNDVSLHNIEYRAEVQRLTQSLLWLNHGQGLGFKLGHYVIDRNTLNSIAGKLFGSLSTIYALLVSVLQDSVVTTSIANTNATDVCDLNLLRVDEISTATGTTWIIVDEQRSNTTCSYANATLGAIWELAIKDD